MPNVSRNVKELPDIVMTTTDVQRLLRLTDDHTSSGNGQPSRFLKQEIDRATVLSPMKIPAAVATMRSRILFRYNDVPQIHEIDLLYPDDSGRHRRKLSVLTHMGTALLGLHEGQAMPFEEPDGSMHRVFVVKVRFQPEALGMYWL